MRATRFSTRRKTRDIQMFEERRCTAEIVDSGLLRTGDLREPFSSALKTLSGV